MSVNADFPVVTGFDVRNPVRIHAINKKSEIWAFESTAYGQTAFRISTVWKSDSTETQWKPGKGFQVPLEQKAALLDALKKLT